MSNSVTLSLPNMANGTHVSLSLTPALLPRTPFQNLPRNPLLSVMQFLPKEDVLSSATVCKKWSRIIDDPGLWRLLLGVTREELALVQNNVREGRYERREILYSVSTVESPFQPACQNRLSNCFVIPENSRENASTQAKVYGLDGRLICNIDLAKFELPGFLPCVTYATAGDIIIIYQGNLSHGSPKGHDTACALFSRAGEFRDTFKVLIPGSQNFLPVERVVAILEKPDQLVFVHEEGKSFATYNFNGTQLSDLYGTSGYKYYCKELRRVFASHFYDEDLQEIFSSMKGKFYKFSWFKRFGQEKPEPRGISANGELLCAYSNAGEIALWDYRTGERLPAIYPPSFERNQYFSVSLIGRNVIVGTNTKDDWRYRHILYDRNGAQKFQVMSARPTVHAPLLPFHSFFVQSASLPSGCENPLTTWREMPQIGWKILDSQGNIVRSFDTVPNYLNRLCHVTPTCLSFTCSDRVVIHDFSPKAKSKLQENSAENARTLDSQSQGCCIVC